MSGNADVVGSVDAERFVSDATSGDAIKINGNKFRVNAQSGDVTTDGVVIIGANSGDAFKINANKFIVNAGTGDVSSTGLVVANDIILNESTGVAFKLHNNNFSVQANGDVAIGRNLSVSGTSTLTGAVAAQSDLTITGASTAQSTLDVTGVTTLQNTLNVTGPSNLSSLNTSGAATLQSTLDVTGASSHTTLSTSDLATLDRCTITKYLAITGSTIANLSDALTVGGQITASRIGTGSDTIVGTNANKSGSNGNTVSIGMNANATNAGANSIAIGNECSNTTKGPSGSGAVGVGASVMIRGENGIAIGNNAKAGSASTHGNAIAIGNAAEVVNVDSVMIGRGTNNEAATFAWGLDIDKIKLRTHPSGAQTINGSLHATDGGTYGPGRVGVGHEPHRPEGPPCTLALIPLLAL